MAPGCNRLTGTNTGRISINRYLYAGTLDIRRQRPGRLPAWQFTRPSLTRNVDFTYAGNSPTWNLTGGVYLPNADVTMSGA